jgi:hypothetical protein
MPALKVLELGGDPSWFDPPPPAPAPDEDGVAPPPPVRATTAAARSKKNGTVTHSACGEEDAHSH